MLKKRLIFSLLKTFRTAKFQTDIIKL